jgi:methionyl-tRNA formyltransferase
MKIAILCTDTEHPVNQYLDVWIRENSAEYEIELFRSKSELTGGDFLFLVSCSEIISHLERSAFTNVLVLHASDLPQGRGWSPHIWEIIDGAEFLTVCLLEADDKVDSGRIWRKKLVPVPRHALWNEINDLLFTAEIKLLDEAVSAWPDIVPEIQDPTVNPTYYRQRTAEDSKLDAEKSLLSQFNLLRVCDPHRFPAIVEINGCQYKLILEKFGD